MKKKLSILLTTIMTCGLIITGCEGQTDAQTAQEYLSDNKDAITAQLNDAAATDQSIVVVENLAEPILEEPEQSNAADAASTESSTEEVLTEEDKTVRIVFFGDSQIANGRNDGSDIPSLMAMRVPNSVVYNLAIGGTTASIEASTTNVNPEDLESQSFLGMTYCLATKSDRAQALNSQRDILSTMDTIDPSTVDYYIIEYGANDFFNNAPLDCSKYEPFSTQAHAFYNAMCAGVDQLKAISPNAQIILMTPFYGIYVAEDGTYIGDSYIVSNGAGTLADYAKKVINVAEDKSVNYFDGMFRTKHDLYLDTADQYLMDNLHLNLTGRQIFARLLAHEINYREGNEPFAYLDADKIEIATFDAGENFRYDELYMRLYYPESWEKYIQGIFPLAQPSEEALNGTIEAQAQQAEQEQQNDGGDESNGE
jgi:lysophospholipase L1-like esterase